MLRRTGPWIDLSDIHFKSGGGGERVKEREREKREGVGRKQTPAACVRDVFSVMDSRKFTEPILQA